MHKIYEILNLLPKLEIYDNYAKTDDMDPPVVFPTKICV